MTTATYDGNALRAATTTTPSGGSATTEDFVWDSRRSMAPLLMDSTNAYIYDGGSLTPAEQVSLATGTVTYLTADSLGSVRGIVSSTGALTGTTAYDAWRNPQTPGGLTAATPFGFAGAYTDPTGLLYLINRYYDPASGQFLSIDPDVSNTQQSYAYANGNPVSTADPAGTNPGPPADWPIEGNRCPNNHAAWCSMLFRDETSDGEDWLEGWFRIVPTWLSADVLWHVVSAPLTGHIHLSQFQYTGHVLCNGTRDCADHTFNIASGHSGQQTETKLQYNGNNLEGRAVAIAIAIHDYCGECSNKHDYGFGRTRWAGCTLPPAADKCTFGR